MVQIRLDYSYCFVYEFQLQTIQYDLDYNNSIGRWLEIVDIQLQIYYYYDGELAKLNIIRFSAAVYPDACQTGRLDFLKLNIASHPNCCLGMHSYNHVLVLQYLI